MSGKEDGWAGQGPGDSSSPLMPRSTPWQLSLAPPATVGSPLPDSPFMTGRMSNCVRRSAVLKSLRAAGPPATSSCTRRRSKVSQAVLPRCALARQFPKACSEERESVRGQRAGLVKLPRLRPPRCKIEEVSEGRF